MELESRILTLTGEEYLRQRDALAERHGVAPDFSALDKARADRARQLGTYAEELRKLEATRGDLTREQFNQRIRQLQERHDIVANTPAPTRETDAVRTR